MLRRRIPQSGHLMTAKRFWLQTVPSEVAIMLQEFPFPWKKMTMMVMILVTDMFRIVTLCWPSPLTPLKQPWSGSETGFTGFRYDQCYQDKVPFFNDNSFGKSLGVKKMPLLSKISSQRQTLTWTPLLLQELTMVTRSLNFSQQRGKLVSCYTFQITGTPAA